MGKLIATQKEWIPLKEAIEDESLNLNMCKIYNLVRRKILRNGFVVKKSSGSNRWELFCRKDYQQWKGI
ncbi:MAG: hypothetical protein PHC75_04980 [Burkholderiales bacterium]|nr:hypothetical protein [Burkholderiales bacterium]